MSGDTNHGEKHWSVEHEVVDYHSVSKNREMTMIKILEGFADNVIAASAIGRVKREDYKAVLIPRVEAIAKKHPKNSVLLRDRHRLRRHGTRCGVGRLWGRG